ncbi:MAG: hypothetical protein KFF73_07470 [Cyclobacteriaceae bacterium]|nr:hypothetical protein [Cyclobacteriaceae bacterium]
MTELNNDWLTDGLIDFEFKKYVLLAYLKDVRQNFRTTKLYPFLADLVYHYKNLMNIQENKKIIYEKFPKVIKEADFEKLKLSYEKIIKDNDVMREIEEIVLFAIEEIEGVLREGREIYEFVEENVDLVPIGISSLYKKEGYMLINEKQKNDVNVYRYQITIFEGPEEKYRGVHTTLIDQFEKSIISTYEDIKMTLIRKHRELPNPATYLVNAKFAFPLNETLLPIAKRLLVRTVNITA